MAAPPKPTPEPLLVSIKDAASMLGVVPWQVYKLAREGDLESVYIGRRRLIPAKALESYVASLPTERPEASA